MSSALAQHPHNGLLRILLIGASGTFGARLARLLAQEKGIALILAGRRRAPLDALAAEIGHNAVAVLDRAALTADDLRRLAVGLVIDASGPFQLMEPHVIETAIAAGVHYLDIADGREFVIGVSQFDAAAKAAGVAVISGASSTPALTNAAFDQIIKDWQRIDHLLVSISPSNRQPRGRAVVEAILSATGQKLRIFSDGAWRAEYGWGALCRLGFPNVGTRWASLCDTPDLDLMVARYQPRVGAEFLASLELPVMHLGLSFLGRVTRAGVLRSAVPLTVPLAWMADRLEPFGNDMGGMIAEAKGQDVDGQPIARRWWLAAKGAIGPNVPVLGALALARKIRDGTLGWTGAAPCAGFLTLADFEPDFAALGMETGVDEARFPPLAIFEQALGVAYGRLPSTTQSIHRPDPVALWRGEGTAEHAATALGRITARLFRLPQGVRNVPVHVVIDQQVDGAERWARVWPDVTMRSVMKTPGKGDGRIEEHFGPFSFVLQLQPHPAGIDMMLTGGRLFGIALPRFLLPRITATERAEGTRHLFNVDIALPLFGRLVRYHGWLEQA
jgi:saccharopine dehydrogenase-like NADP-dependent oxidoreductase